MAQIKCLTLEGGLIRSNQYTTSKDKTYYFSRGTSTEIKDKEDANFFLKAGGGKLFIRTDKVEQVKKKVKEVVTGKKEEIEEKAKMPVYTEKELFAMTKREQMEIIKKVAGSNMRVPHYEKDRVKLILKYQK